MRDKDNKAPQQQGGFNPSKPQQPGQPGQQQGGLNRPAGTPNTGGTSGKKDDTRK